MERDGMGWVGWVTPAGRPLLEGAEGSALRPRGAAGAHIKPGTARVDAPCRQGLMMGQFSAAEPTGYTSGVWLKL